MPRGYLEVTGGILRLYERADAGPRDPFDKVLYVKGDLGVAHLAGFRDDDMRGYLDPEWRHEIARELCRHDFHTAMWRRISGKDRPPFIIDLALL